MSSAVQGLAGGFVDKKNLAEIARTLGLHATTQFGEVADASANSMGFPHVYEFLGEHSDDVNTSPGGRLWRLKPTVHDAGVTFSIVFEQSQEPGGPNSRLRDKYPNMAAHLFPDKATHLETNPVLTARVGVQQYTTRVPRSPHLPKTLIYLEGGRIRRTISRTWSNEFFGKFQRFFEDYWATQYIVASEAKTRQAARGVQRFTEAEIAREAASVRAASRTPVPKRPGLTVYNQGRPSTGIGRSPGKIRSSADRMKKFLRKEVLRAWRT